MVFYIHFLQDDDISGEIIKKKPFQPDKSLGFFS